MIIKKIGDITISVDGRKTNNHNDKDFYGKRKTMYIASKNGCEGFDYTIEKAIKNLENVLKLKK